jgi:large subunit ribosomal protein L2
MSLISYRPTTPSLRKTVKVDKTSLFKGRPEKSLSSSQQSSAGRNNTGKITIRHRSAGHKKKYRIINFKRNTLDLYGSVERIEYDPNRTAFIALVSYDNNSKEYIIAPSDLKISDKVLSSEKTEVKVGNCMKLKNIPAGTSIHNIEIKPGAGGKLCRSAGTFAQVLGSNDSYIMIKLSSRETRLISSDCKATIGVVSNSDNKNKKIGKAGIKRHLGIKPTVRGVAMNPVDHPHGGGEGRTSGVDILLVLGA